MGRIPGSRAGVRAGAVLLAGGMLSAAPMAAFAAEAPAVASRGMAPAMAHPGVVWTSDDGTTGTSVTAMSYQGSTLARLTLDKVKPGHWEALTSVRFGDTPYLYVGDLGAPDEGCRDIVVHRLAEPAALEDRTIKPSTFRLEYPDGAYHATALLASPDNGRLSLITREGAERALARVRLPARAAAPVPQPDWRAAAMRVWSGASVPPPLLAGIGRWSFAAPAVLAALLLGLIIPPRRSAARPEF